MADATVALTVAAFPNGVDNTQKRQIVYGTAAITANGGTSPATGLPLNWKQMLDGNLNNAKYFQPLAGPNSSAPDFVTFIGNSDVAQQYSYNKASDALLVWGSGAPLTDSIVADTVNFKAEWIRGGF